VGYRPTQPWAYPALLPQRVPPFWRPPMPIGVINYPEPMAPGQQYIPDFADNYCAGGARNRGVQLDPYLRRKDLSALGSMSGVGRGSFNLAPRPDPYQEYLEDGVEYVDVPSVVRGSYNMSTSDEVDAEVLEILGLDPDEVDALFAADSMSYGEEAAAKRPFAKVSALFKRDQSGTSRIERTSDRIDRLQNRLLELQQRYGPQAAQPVGPPPPGLPVQAPAGGMSTGAKVGIGVGAAVLVGLAGYGIFKAVS